MHDDPHFEDSPVRGRNICVCMCPECYNPKPHEEIGMGCICPDCGHHVKEDEDEKVVPGDPGSSGTVVLDRSQLRGSDQRPDGTERSST